MDVCKTEKILISVIVPVYNVEPYLERCLESILHQDYHNLQIILVDDGSTDASGHICDRYALVDNRVEVIHKANGGLSYARNVGIATARGQYIGFVDSDDYIEKNMYSSLLKGICEYDADISCCGRYYKDKTEYTLDDSVTYNAHDAIREMLIGKKIDCAAWDKLYKAEQFKDMDIRFPLGEINEDLLVELELMHKASRIVHIGKPLYHYISREGSLTHKAYDYKKIDIYRHILQVKRFIADYYIDLHEYVYNLEFTNLISLLGMITSDRKIMSENRQDYDKYIDLFNKDYKAMMKSTDVRTWVKLRSFLTKHHMYNFMKTILRK